MELTMNRTSGTIAKIRDFCMKYREILVYIIVGGGTTAMGWGCKYLWNLIFFDRTAFPTVAQNTVLSIVENLSAIVYAYPANRKWVFRSTDPNIMTELLRFTASRQASWILSWVLNMLLVNALNVNVFLSTVLAGFLGAACNFFLSKLLVFGKREQEAVSSACGRVSY